LGEFCDTLGSEIFGMLDGMDMIMLVSLSLGTASPTVGQLLILQQILTICFLAMQITWINNLSNAVQTKLSNLSITLQTLWM
jgi:hypothetical protein